MTDVTGLAHDLVSIPSHEDETEVGDYIEEWLLEKTDADVSRDNAGNIIARRGVGNKSLAFVGHHDVVAPDSSQLDGTNYIVEEQNDRLYGRGAADMKGSVAAMMWAFRDADPTCELAFASFVGEETSGTGAQHAIEKGFAPDYATVGEGSTNYSGPDVTDIVAAHRGRQERTITAHGISSHASEPEVGENAIYRAYDAIEVLRGLDVPSIELYGEELLASATVTQITGGTTSNVIPDTCDLTVDERTIPGKDIQLDQVKEIENIDLTVENKFPPMQCDDDAFAETVLGAAVDVQENKPQIVTKPHATDAGWLADAGTTCVVCGGSEPGEAHTKTESVNLDVLDRCYRIYRSVAERL